MLLVAFMPRLPHKIISTTNRLSFKTLFTVVFFLLIGIVTLIRITQKPHLASAAWWNDAWGYRKAVTVRENSGSNINSFPVQITLSALGSKIQANCADLRITDNNNQLIPHQLDICDPNNDTTVWIQTNLAASQSQTFYVYYGNPSAPAPVYSTADRQLSAAANTATDHNFVLQNSLVALKGNTANISGAIRNLIDVASGKDGAQPNGGSSRVDYHWENAQGDAPGVPGSETVVADGPLYKTISWTEAHSYFTVYRKATVFANYPLVFQQWSLKNTSGAAYTYSSGHHSMTESGRCFAYGSGGCISPNFSGGGGSGGDYGWFLDNNAGIGMCKIRSSSSTVGNTWRASGNPNPALTLNNQQTSGWYQYYLTPITSATQCQSFYNTQYAQTGTATLNAEEQSQGPVAYWKFDEGNGTTVFDSASQNNLAVFGPGNSAPAWSGNDQCVANTCLSFNGNNYIDLGSSSKYGANSSNGAYTIEAWIKPNNFNSYNTITHHVGGFDYFAVANGTGQLRTMVHDAVNNVNFWPSSNKAVVANSWNHVVFIFQSGVGYKFYINGILDSNVSNPNLTFYNYGSPAYIAFGTDSTSFFHGFIDEVKIFAYARNDVQIKSDYTAGLSHSTANKGIAANLASNNQSYSGLNNGLVAYWKMDENSWNGTAGEVKDASGNGANGTAVGATLPSVISGKFGNAAAFSGIAHYIDLTNLSLNTTNTGSKTTVSFWMYWNGNSGGMPFGFPSYDLYFNSTTSFGFNTGNSDLFGFNPTGLANTWVYVTAIFVNNTPDQSELYINGVKQPLTLTGSQLNRTVSSTARIATWPNNTGYNFSGKIDEFRIYNRGLTPDEIQQLYNWAPPPVAYYNLNEAGGSFINNTGSIGDTGIWFGTGSHWAAGKYGSAARFNGADDYISLGYPLNSPDNWTYDFWFYPEEAPATNFQGLMGESNQPRVTWNTGSVVEFGLNYQSGSWAGGPHSAALAPKNWYHVAAVVYNGSTSSPVAKLYINGTEVGSTTYTQAIRRPNGRHYIDLRDSAMTFKGRIDDVRIYNYARSPRQITEDMNGGHPVGGSPVGSQIAYWKFDEGFGSTTKDSSVNSYTGNINTATWSNNGRFNKALSFNGSTDYVYINNASTLNGLKDITVSAWVYPTSYPNIGCIYQHGSSNSVHGYFWFCTGTSGKLYLDTEDVGTSNHKTLNGNGVLPLNQWSHVALSISGPNINFYINGKLDQTSTFNGMYPLTPAGTSYYNRDNIGAWFYSSTTPGYQFNGLIDEIKVYSTGLNANDLALEYNQGKTLVMGSKSTESDGKTPSFSSARTYCLPGDTSTCSPPVAEWKLDEGSGTTANDTSGNNNAATVSGPVWTQGKIGSALNFNGTTDYVSANKTFSFPMTLEFWMKSSDTSRLGHLIYSSEGSGDGYCADNETHISENGGSLYIFSNTNGTNHINRSTGIPVDSNWHHITVVFDSTYQLYVDGILKDSAALSGTPDFTNYGNFTYLGKPSANTRYYKGLLDQVMIYNYSRTPAQIAWDYNRGGPVGWWKFDECQGSSIADWSMNGNTGSLNIGPTGSQSSAGTCGTSGTAWGNGSSGKYNSSLNFDGTDDYVDLGNQAALNFASQDFTVSFWGSSSSYITSKGIIAKGLYWTSPGPGWAFTNISNPQHVYFNTYDGSTQSYLDTGIGPTYGWTHFVGIKRGNKIEVWVNGRQIASTSAPAGSLANTQNLTFAKGPSGYWNGQLDDVRIYGYALTSAQIQTLYNGGAIKFSP